jgi:anti-anti-sigma factor
MELTEEALDDVTIVAVTGRLDAGAARQFGERLTTLIRGGRLRLLIEASQLEYIGSLGLRALLIASSLAAEVQGRFAVCAMTAPVRRVVELAGLSAVFEGYPSREAALESLRTSG